MALPAELRRILEARMQGYEYQSDFARKYYGQGRKEGRQAGRKEGRQAGRKEGRQAGRKEGRQAGRKEGRHEGLRAAVVALARTKLGELSDDDLAAIEAMSDQRLLTELVTLLGQARSSRSPATSLSRGAHALRSGELVFYSACSSTTTAKTMNATHATENNTVLARNRPKPLMWITTCAMRA
jgi:hypothetical protein